jgi:hypothetical protein
VPWRGGGGLVGVTVSLPGLLQLSLWASYRSLEGPRPSSGAPLRGGGGLGGIHVRLPAVGIVFVGFVGLYAELRHD